MKKYGRNEAFCKRYRAENRRLRNKRKRLQRHLKQERHANDKQAQEALNLL